MIQDQELEKEWLKIVQEFSKVRPDPEASACNTARRLAQSAGVDRPLRPWALSGRRHHTLCMVPWSTLSFPQSTDTNTTCDMETCGVLCGKLMREDVTSYTSSQTRCWVWLLPHREWRRHFLPTGTRYAHTWVDLHVPHTGGLPLQFRQSQSLLSQAMLTVSTAAVCPTAPRFKETKPSKRTDHRLQEISFCSSKGFRTRKAYCGHVTVEA